MDPALRKKFNAGFSEKTYAELVKRLEGKLECKFEFRLAETPVFLPRVFRERAERAAREIVSQLSDPKRIAAMERDLPARYATPRRGRLPGVAIVDFAVVRDATGELATK